MVLLLLKYINFYCILVNSNNKCLRGVMCMATDKKRLTVRINQDLANQLNYFAKAYPDRWSSENELVGVALDHYIAFINGDYKLPTLEAMRTNQLIDMIVAMQSTMDGMQSIMVNGFEAILQLHKGGSYLMEDDDGELET